MTGYTDESGRWHDDNGETMRDEHDKQAPTEAALRDFCATVRRRPPTEPPQVTRAPVVDIASRRQAVPVHIDDKPTCQRPDWRDRLLDDVLAADPMRDLARSIVERIDGLRENVSRDVAMLLAECSAVAAAYLLATGPKK